MWERKRQNDDNNKKKEQNNTRIEKFDYNLMVFELICKSIKAFLLFFFFVTIFHRLSCCSHYLYHKILLYLRYYWIHMLFSFNFDFVCVFALLCKNANYVWMFGKWLKVFVLHTHFHSIWINKYVHRDNSRIRIKIN